jgi:hypothetical protein
MKKKIIFVAGILAIMSIVIVPSLTAVQTTMVDFTDLLECSIKGGFGVKYQVKASDDFPDYWPMPTIPEGTVWCIYILNTTFTSRTEIADLKLPTMRPGDIYTNITHRRIHNIGKVSASIRIVLDEKEYVLAEKTGYTIFGFTIFN